MTEHNWLSTFHFVLKMQGKTKLLYSSKAVPFSEPSILFEDAMPSLMTLSAGWNRQALLKSLDSTRTVAGLLAYKEKPLKEPFRAKDLFHRNRYLITNLSPLFPTLGNNTKLLCSKSWGVLVNYQFSDCLLTYEAYKKAPYQMSCLKKILSKV